MSLARAPKNIEKDYCTNIRAAQIALQITSDILSGQNGADYQHALLTQIIDQRIADQRPHRRLLRWVKRRLS